MAGEQSSAFFLYTSEKMPKDGILISFLMKSDGILNGRCGRMPYSCGIMMIGSFLPCVTIIDIVKYLQIETEGALTNMKRIISAILAVALLFSVAMAEKKQHSPDYEDVANKLFSLTEDELLDIKELVDALVSYNEGTREKEQKEQQKMKEEELGIWAEKYFVDSFNEPTKDKYITTSKMIEGTFSNSAATNRQLKVKLLISLTDDKKTPSVGIELYEYGDNRVNNGGVKVNPYSLYLRDSSGNTKNFGCYMPKKGNRIYIDEELSNFGFGTRQDFVEILKSSKTVKFRMTDDDKYSNSSYSFEIEDTTGFDKAYEWLFSDEE